MEHPEITLAELYEMIEHMQIGPNSQMHVIYDAYMMEKRCLERLKLSKPSDKRKSI
jgi:hypothetical protein